MINIKADFFKPQLAFLRDNSPLSAFIGGIGSGKTLTGARWLLKEALSNNGLNFYACANTYPQLKDVLYPKFFSTLADWQLREGKHWHFNKTNKDLKFFNGSTIMFRSLQNYNLLRGAEVSAALIDEARDTSEEAVEVIIGRLRQSKNAKLKITTTPNGYNWLYDWIKEGKIKTFKMTTYDNTLLPQSYIAFLENQYKGLFYRQELLAEFVNFGGQLVYFEFSRPNNIYIVNIKPASNETIHIGLDFNIDPFCAIAGVYRQGKIYAFQEIALHGLDVKAMISEIKKLWPTNPIIVYPDSSGKNRNVLSMQTAINMLKNAFGDENVKFFRVNPRVVNRIQTVNTWLSKGDLLISRHCKRLIKDFERVKFVNTGAFELDKKDKELTHISDALGYMVYYLEKQKLNIWEQY